MIPVAVTSHALPTYIVMMSETGAVEEVTGVQYCPLEATGTATDAKVRMRMRVIPARVRDFSPPPGRCRKHAR